MEEIDLQDFFRTVASWDRKLAIVKGYFQENESLWDTIQEKWNLYAVAVRNKLSQSEVLQALHKKLLEEEEILKEKNINKTRLGKLSKISVKLTNVLQYASVPFIGGSPALITSAIAESADSLNRHLGKKNFKRAKKTYEAALAAEAKLIEEIKLLESETVDLIRNVEMAEKNMLQTLINNSVALSKLLLGCPYDKSLNDWKNWIQSILQFAELVQPRPISLPQDVDNEWSMHDVSDLLTQPSSAIHQELIHYKNNIDKLIKTCYENQDIVYDIAHAIWLQRVETLFSALKSLEAQMKIHIARCESPKNEKNKAAAALRTTANEDVLRVHEVASALDECESRKQTVMQRINELTGQPSLDPQEVAELTALQTERGQLELLSEQLTTAHQDAQHAATSSDTAAVKVEDDAKRLFFGFNDTYQSFLRQIRRISLLLDREVHIFYNQFDSSATPATRASIAAIVQNLSEANTAEITTTTTAATTVASSVDAAPALDFTAHVTPLDIVPFSPSSTITTTATTTATTITTSFTPSPVPESTKSKKSDFNESDAPVTSTQDEFELSDASVIRIDLEIVEKEAMKTAAKERALALRQIQHWLGDKVKELQGMQFADLDLDNNAYPLAFRVAVNDTHNDLWQNLTLEYMDNVERHENLWWRLQQGEQVSEEEVASIRSQTTATTTNNDTATTSGDVLAARLVKDTALATLYGEAKLKAKVSEAEFMAMWNNKSIFSPSPTAAASTVVPPPTPTLSAEGLEATQVMHEDHLYRVGIDAKLKLEQNKKLLAEKRAQRAEATANMTKKWFG